MGDFYQLIQKEETDPYSNDIGDNIDPDEGEGQGKVSSSWLRDEHVRTRHHSLDEEGS